MHQSSKAPTTRQVWAGQAARNQPQPGGSPTEATHCGCQTFWTRRTMAESWSAARKRPSPGSGMPTRYKPRWLGRGAAGQEPCLCRTPAIGVELGAGQQTDSLAFSKWWALRVLAALALRSASEMTLNPPAFPSFLGVPGLTGNQKKSLDLFLPPRGPKTWTYRFKRSFTPISTSSRS